MTSTSTLSTLALGLFAFNLGVASTSRCAEPCLSRKSGLPAWGLGGAPYGPHPTQT